MLSNRKYEELVAELMDSAKEIANDDSNFLTDFNCITEASRHRRREAYKALVLLHIIVPGSIERDHCIWFSNLLGGTHWLTA